MKKLIIGLLSVAAIVSLGAAFGCKKEQTTPSVVVNGGFESADLSGWTVEYGDAYDDDSVSSRKNFSYTADIDPHGYVIPVNQTGNWYLSGKGFDNKRPSTCTGAIRSENFVLGGDGNISMKLAGGAAAMARSDTAAQKPVAEVCYVGVYRVSDDKMIAYQTNRYFAEDSSNIELTDYENGTCYTDNFCTYTIDLSSYIGEELYIRIVDNDTNYYYGYLSVDDIRIGKTAEAQEEGAYFSKTAPVATAEAESIFGIPNDGFETGNLSGWTVTEGLAFSDDGVNPDPYWWAEQIPYGRDGSYHYGYYNPTATGRMRSANFTVGGTGYITYKLGGCADNNAAYLRFMKVVEGGEDIEVLKTSNFGYKDMQFPNVQNGLRVINLNQYRLDFSQYIGQTMYIEVVDENSSDNMAGCVVLDSVQTYHKEVPTFTDWFDVEYIPSGNPEMVEDYQIPNGSFETGDLTDWEISGDFGNVIADDTWWAERLPYNKSSKYLFSGLANERGKGTLTSKPFTVAGSGLMTFRLGGAHDPRFCYISILKENGEEVARYGNLLFHDAGVGLVNKGTNLANMVTYRADLSEWMGQRLRIRITDNADSNWGLVTADDFVTYFTDGDVQRFPPDSKEATNLLRLKGNPETVNDYQIPNGSFESGDLTGWTREGGNIGNLSYDYLWWNEWYTYNSSGMYFFSGFSGNEGDRGTLTSEAFTVAGSGIITYRLGGGMDSSLCYLEVVDADDVNRAYYRFGNENFSTQGGVYTGYPITVGCEGFGANMVLYKADISALMGKRVRLRLTDNATKDWGLLFADDFVTYYENADSVPKSAAEATDILPMPEFEDVTRTLNLAHADDSVKLQPKQANDLYRFAFSMPEEVQDVTLDGDTIKVAPQGEINTDFEKSYSFTVEITIENIATNDKTTQTIRVNLTAIYDNRQIVNGGFESGDLTGWTTVIGDIKTGDAVISAETFWGENLPYNQSGSYHFDGEFAQYNETDNYALRSSDFILSGSGYISFKMAGRAAVLKVFKSDGTQIAEYDNTQFANINFPHVDEGCILKTMVTFVADLREYMGQELYIEICDDKQTQDWGIAVFDEIVTYYETAPEVTKNCDTVKLNQQTSSTGEACDLELKWVTAVNKLN